MWQKFLRWITLQKLQFQHRKNNSHIISFNKALLDAEKILIFLPWNFKEYHVARYVLKYLSHDDTKHQITYVVPQVFGGSIPIRPNDRIIGANGTSREKDGLFSKEFEQQIQQEEFNVAADFSRTFDLGTSTLCLKSGAPLRIGLESPYSYLFFNVEVEEPSDKFPLENVYRTIQKMLSIENDIPHNPKD